VTHPTRDSGARRRDAIEPDPGGPRILAGRHLRGQRTSNNNGRGDGGGMGDESYLNLLDVVGCHLRVCLATRAPRGSPRERETGN
jgi:hypothetical protein